MLKIPSYAKSHALRGLFQRRKYPRSERPGLGEKEAKRLGVYSGVRRAKELVRRKYVSEEDAKRIIAFYERFKNCRTRKCEVALNLWGGRKFALYLKRRIKRK